MIFCAAALQAAPMGTADKISDTLTVRNDFWQCSFIEGSIFPSDFVFKNGTRPGVILFRDIASVGKNYYTLHDERHAERRIISNTADECIIETSGTFWRNQNPVISALQGVTVSCRYEFKRNSSIVKMQMKYINDSKENIRFHGAFDMTWYFKNPFDDVSIGGRKIDLKRAMKPVNPFYGKKNAVFANDECKVVYQAENICIIYAGRGHFPLSVSSRTDGMAKTTETVEVLLQLEAVSSAL